MKHRVLQTALALLMLTGVRSQPADSNESNLKALAANAATFVEAYNKADPDTLAELFLPEGEIVLANGEIVAGREEITKFDALGGYTRSEWTAAENGWLLRTTGVTADGEANQSTQTLVPDENRQGFTWSSRDQTLGGEVQADRTIRVVKRPPEINRSPADRASADDATSFRQSNPTE